jgi:hypothetical protein
LENFRDFKQSITSVIISLNCVFGNNLFKRKLIDEQSLSLFICLSIEIYFELFNNIFNILSNKEFKLNSHISVVDNQ